jgi:hypothetical protein
VRSIVRVYPGPPFIECLKRRRRIRAPGFPRNDPRRPVGLVPLPRRLCVSGADVLGPIGSDPSSLREDGAIAQLGERLICIQEVVGSIPSGSTNCASLIGSGSWWFWCLSKSERSPYGSSVQNEFPLPSWEWGLFDIVKRMMTRSGRSCDEIGQRRVGTMPA